MPCPSNLLRRRAAGASRAHVGDPIPGRFCQDTDCPPPRSPRNASSINCSFRSLKNKRDRRKVKVWKGPRSVEVDYQARSTTRRSIYNVSRCFPLCCQKRMCHFVFHGCRQLSSGNSNSTTREAWQQRNLMFAFDGSRSLRSLSARRPGIRWGRSSLTLLEQTAISKAFHPYASYCGITCGSCMCVRMCCVLEPVVDAVTSRRLVGELLHAPIASRICHVLVIRATEYSNRIAPFVPFSRETKSLRDCCCAFCSRGCSCRPHTKPRERRGCQVLSQQLLSHSPQGRRNRL